MNIPTPFHLTSVVVGILLLSGCAALDVGQDPVVVRAEQTTAVAWDSLDAFLAFEYRHRAELPVAVQDAADELRTRAPDVLRAVRTLTKTYKLNRTPENKGNLDTALAVLQALAQQASCLLAGNCSLPAVITSEPGTTAIKPTSAADCPAGNCTVPSTK